MAGGRKKKKKKRQGKAECEKKLERKRPDDTGFYRPHERQCSLSLKAGGVCLTPRVKLSDSHFRKT